MDSAPRILSRRRLLRTPLPDRWPLALLARLRLLSHSYHPSLRLAQPRRDARWTLARAPRLERVGTRHARVRVGLPRRRSIQTARGAARRCVARLARLARNGQLLVGCVELRARPVARLGATPCSSVGARRDGRGVEEC